MDLVLRSTLPTSSSSDTSYYDPWKEWANMNEWRQWKRTNPYVPSIYSLQQQQQQQQQLYFSMPMPTANLGLSALMQSPTPGIIQAASPEVRQQIPQSYVSSSSGYGNVQPMTETQKRCDQCNGDCSNYLCYGCGGCPEPPPEQQLYYYPYQKQDAGIYHNIHF